MIRGIEWRYGSGKTSYAVRLMTKEYKSHFIWTNIHLDQDKFPNSVIFPDRDLLTVMQTINRINDLERSVYAPIPEGSTLPQYDRNAFTQHVIFFDEWSSHINARDWKEQTTKIFQYLDQERKLFLDIYILTPSSQTIDIAYRRMIEEWITVESPYPQWLPYFKNIRKAQSIAKDQNGQPILESFIDKDEQGTPIMKQRPIIRDLTRFWFNVSKYWPLYDDLHKNITDDYKPQGFYEDMIKNWLPPPEQEEHWEVDS